MLTPIDIQNHTLKTSMSGYNKKDTEEFLASILDSYETLFRENRTLKEKITSLSEGIQYYKQMENTLQKALILAEKTSTETQEAAKAQADQVIKDAQEKAEKIIKDTETEAGNKKAEAEAAAREAEEKAGRVIMEAQSEAEAVTKKAAAEAESITRKAREEAERLISEAEEKAAQVISEAKKQTADIKGQAQDELDGIRINAIQLVQDYDKYCNQVRKFATAQLALLENEEYKLHVTEFDIENNEKDMDTNTSKEEPADIQEEMPENYKEENTNNIINNSIIVEEKTEKENSHKENKKDKGKFSWNSDENGYAAAKEPETPFTFIDPD